MGGPSSQNKQQQITDTGTTISAQQYADSRADKAKADTLTAPAIAHNQDLISGDPKVATAAAAPIIGNISKGFNAAKESIYDTVGPGAGRDYALANLPLQQNAATATAVTNETLGAFDKLFNEGAGIGSFSLQELGGSLSALSGASSSNQAVMSAQEAEKASTMGFLGSLAGGAGTAIGGKLSGSDSRLKKNVRDLGNKLDLIRSVRLVNFDYIGGPKNRPGVVAQEVRAYFPEAVSSGGAGGFLYVDYDHLHIANIKALQELADLVEKQSKRIEELEHNAVFHPYVEVA